MRGLVLQGGGAFGSYQLGVLEALEEKNIEFDGVVGTSIGSVNAALYIQGGPGQLRKAWEETDYSEVFDGEEVLKVMAEFSLKNAIRHWAKIQETISDGGIEVINFYRLMQAYIDEDKIRSSPKDFGLVVFNRDKREGEYLFIEDIGRGQLQKMIIASCYMPGFKRYKIMGTTYYDGGFADNLPFSMLVDKGYDDLYLIKCGGIGREKDIPKGSNFKVIEPRLEMKGLMDFSKDTMKRRILKGYLDAKVFLGDYYGDKYTLDIDLASWKERLVPTTAVQKRLARILRIPAIKKFNGKASFYMYILPAIGVELGLSYPSDDEVFIALVEFFLSTWDYDPVKVYGPEIFKEIRDQAYFQLSFSKEATINNIIYFLFKGKKDLD